eukprot:m.19382 g.19382  ORF g.19382 m.19382 type:complete len:270 (-) comp3434_c0_seq1:246-1055(-)
MPLVVICGFPCSGKSARTDELAAVLHARGKAVHVVRDMAPGESPSATYGTPTAEKLSRGALKSEVDRLLQKDTVVIADGPNYIKGYRYELYCIARSMKTPHCVIHVAASKDTCAGWNATTARYPEALFNELVSRFECPDSRNRWDSPLFTCVPEESLPQDAIYQALFESSVAAPTLSVQSQPLSATNFLHELDSITQDIIAAMLKAQATFVPGDAIAVPGCDKKVTLKRAVGLPELRRLRRQFIAFTKTHPMGVPQIASTFVEFLEHGL